MPSSLSPYALLKASKPRQMPTVITTYDLFSTAQMEPHSMSSATEQAEASPVNPRIQEYERNQTPFSPLYIPKSTQRTHYIADIHARHNAAGCHSPMRPI